MDFDTDAWMRNYGSVIRLPMQDACNALCPPYDKPCRHQSPMYNRILAKKAHILHQGLPQARIVIPRTIEYIQHTADQLAFARHAFWNPYVYELRYRVTTRNMGWEHAQWIINTEDDRWAPDVLKDFLHSGDGPWNYIIWEGKERNPMEVFFEGIDTGGWHEKGKGNELTLEMLDCRIRQRLQGKEAAERVKAKRAEMKARDPNQLSSVDKKLVAHWTAQDNKERCGCGCHKDYSVSN